MDSDTFLFAKFATCFTFFLATLDNHVLAQSSLYSRVPYWTIDFVFVY